MIRYAWRWITTQWECRHQVRRWGWADPDWKRPKWMHRYAQGGEVGKPNDRRPGDIRVLLSRGMASFDGGRTWQYTDEDPVLDKINKPYKDY